MVKIFNLIALVGCPASLFIRQINNGWIYPFAIPKMKLLFIVQIYAKEGIMSCIYNIDAHKNEMQKDKTKQKMPSTIVIKQNKKKSMNNC